MKAWLEFVILTQALTNYHHTSDASELVSFKNKYIYIFNKKTSEMMEFLSQNFDYSSRNEKSIFLLAFSAMNMSGMKEILGVHCKAHNDACRAELARLPMKNKIKHSIIGFLVHLLSDENTLVYEIYTSTKNSNPWVKLTKNMLDSLGYSYLINNISR